MGLASTLYAFSLLRAAFTIDWCDKSLDCEAPNGSMSVVTKNTMCQSTEHESINDCHNMVARQTSASQTLLAMHNTFRDRIASGTLLPGWQAASDMRQMSWDDSLAEQALRWAFQCENKEDDPCRTHPLYKFDEGQNYGVVVQSNAVASPDVEYVFRNWIQWTVNATPAILAAGACSQEFPEIMFSKAHKIGCGVIDYHDETGKKAVRAVCNYNNEYTSDIPLYIQGPACTSCPPETSCKSDSTYKNLCALRSDPIDEAPIVVNFNGDVLEPTAVEPAVSVASPSPVSATSQVTTISEKSSQSPVPSKARLPANGQTAVRCYQFILTISFLVNTRQFV